MLEACPVGVGRLRRGKEVEGRGARWPGPLSLGTPAVGAAPGAGGPGATRDGPFGSPSGPTAGSRRRPGCSLLDGREWLEGTQWLGVTEQPLVRATWGAKGGAGKGPGYRRHSLKSGS